MKDLSRYNNSKHRLAVMAIIVLAGLLYWQLGAVWTLVLAAVIIGVAVYRHVSRKSSAELARDRLLRERQVELGATADQTGRAVAGQMPQT